MTINNTPDPNSRDYLLENNPEVPATGLHSKNNCKVKMCRFHEKTDHHMRTWKEHFIRNNYALLRECKHGILHPDPDDPLNKFHFDSYKSFIDCDGCCELPFENFPPSYRLINQKVVDFRINKDYLSFKTEAGRVISFRCPLDDFGAGIFESITNSENLLMGEEVISFIERKVGFKLTYTIEFRHPLGLLTSEVTVNRVNNPDCLILAATCSPPQIKGADKVFEKIRNSPEIILS